MPRVLPLAVALVCAVSAAARADGAYVSESFGGTKVHDELGREMAGAFRVRLAIGVRHDRWAVEGWVAGDLSTDSVAGPRGPSDRAVDGLAPDALVAAGVDVKYLQPVAQHVELYLRGGLGRAGLVSGELDGYAGRGIGVGAGVQLKGKVSALGLLAWPLFFTGWGPKITAAVFIDDGFDFYRLHRGGDLQARAVDAQLSRLTVGFALGSDF